MSSVTKVIMWVIVAAIVVLVVTHAIGASQVITSGGSQGINGLKLLTGAGQTGGTSGTVASGSGSTAYNMTAG